jgi:hypothetical protein
MELFGNPTGITEQESYHTNTLFTPGVLISNTLRNTSLHFVLPVVDRWMGGGFRVILRPIHTMLGLDLSDTRTTFGGMEYRPPLFSTNEDTTANLLHTLLIILALVLLQRWRGRPRLLVAYSATVVTTFLLFSLLLRWQPWHSRQHTTLFLLWAPLIAVVLDQWRHVPLVTRLPYVLLLAASPWIVHNETRPLIGIDNQSIIFSQRSEQMFIQRPELLATYATAARLIAEHDCTAVGLISRDRSFWEYALWSLLQDHSRQPVRIESLAVLNVSERLRDRITSNPPCALIVAGQPPAPVLELGGRNYMPIWHVEGLMVQIEERLFVGDDISS